MDIFSVITLIGGLAFFLYGMNVMSSGLERMAGGKLEHILKKATSNRFKSLLLGVGITAVIQSSSAMTVMLVGLVNSGIMNIGQSIGVIMGSNIGTTVTSWLLSLVGLESDNMAMKMLKPENFSLVFAFIGIILIMMAKSTKKKDVGSILLGFAILMYGMKLMSGAVAPLADSPKFASILTAFTNPVLGVLVGALFTGVIQSSSASVGILQALSLTGGITYGMALPIIMGQNIGTCVTALISSIGVSRNARKVAVVHVSFNVIGTIVFLTVYYTLNAFIGFAFTDDPINALGIAVVHSIFNVTTTLILLPFTKFLERFANFVLKDKDGIDSGKAELLDSRLLATPSVAISECNNITVKMAKLAKETLVKAMALVQNYDEKTADVVLENESVLDNYEDKLGTYLVKISSQKLSESDSQKVSMMLHSIGDFERLGDHAVNLLKTAKEISEKSVEFSEKAKKELVVLSGAIEEVLGLTYEAYKEKDVQLATKIEPLEQVIDRLVATIKSNHIKRLQDADCSLEKGFILSDLLTSYERVSDYCSNIAVSLIEISHNTFDTHKYLNNIKYGNNSFNEIFDQYSIKYSI